MMCVCGDCVFFISVPSLRFMCMEFILGEEIPIDPMPLALRQSLYVCFVANVIGALPCTVLVLWNTPPPPQFLL